MKKIFLIPILLFFAACSGKSLLNQNQNTNLDTSQGSSTVLFQISTSPLQSDSQFEISNYRIHLSRAGMVISNVQFLQETASANIRVHHAGEDHQEEEHPDSAEHDEHVEPSTCDFEGSLNTAVYLDLTKENALPCVKMPWGNYAGLQFTFAEAQEALSGMPEGMHGSIHLEGHALHLDTNTEYPFHMHAELNDTVQLPHTMNLNAENHHIEIQIDLANWFHGFDFSNLQQTDGEVLLDETHNEHRFEHMLEHMKESFTIR